MLKLEKELGVGVKKRLKILLIGFLIQCKIFYPKLWNGCNRENPQNLNYKKTK